MPGQNTPAVRRESGGSFRAPTTISQYLHAPVASTVGTTVVNLTKATQAGPSYLARFPFQLATIMKQHWTHTPVAGLQLPPNPGCNHVPAKQEQPTETQPTPAGVASAQLHLPPGSSRGTLPGPKEFTCPQPSMACCQSEAASMPEPTSSKPAWSFLYTCPQLAATATSDACQDAPGSG